MKRFILQILFLLFIILINENIHAQDKDSLKTYVLEETVVTGTRYEVNKDKLPLSISVISRSDIEKVHEINILPLIDNYVPGLFLNDRNILGYGAGPLSTGQISIRGIGENPNSGVLVLVDGQPQFMGIFGHPINDSYLISTAERVEIIRGPASLLYGSNALGGTVNIITKKTRLEGLSLNSSVAYGSFNTSMLTASGSYKKDNFNLSASFSSSMTDGHREDGDDDFKSNSVFSKLSYQFNKNFDITVDGNITDSKFYEPGPETAAMKNQFYDYLRGRGAISFENKCGTTEGALKLFYNYGKHNFFDGWRSTDNMSGLTVYQSLKFYGENIFTGGFEYKNFGGKGENAYIPPVAPGAIGLNETHSVDETEAYGILNLALIPDLTLSSGLRFTNNSVYGSELTPQFGFSYIINNLTIIKGNAGRAFRSPTIADLFLFPVANENLEPESIWSYEISISKFLIDQVINSELTFFYLNADNIIQVIPSSAGMRKVNTGSFNNKGIELAVSYLPGGKFSSGINYSYLNTSIKLPYAPEHKANIHLEYNFNVFTFASDLQGIFNLLTSGSLKKENYFTFSASADIMLTEWFSFFIRGINLTDEKYYIDEGYPSQGISFLTGMKLKY